MSSQKAISELPSASSSTEISHESEFNLHGNEHSGKQIFCYMNGFMQRLAKDNSKMANSSDLHVYRCTRKKAFIQLFGDFLNKINSWKAE